MSKYDLYKTNKGSGYLLDVQTDLLAIQSTRMLVPLLEETQTPGRIKNLHPILMVDGKRFVMATHLMAAVPVSALSTPVANLATDADDITRALDFLFQGY